MLLGIGAFMCLLQCLVIVAQAILGNIEALFVFGIPTVLFWLQFYFVWIGVHWLRWLWGGWNLLTGFCLFVWAWRDLSALETLYATINFLIGAALCSPSVYFFAKRQKEIVRWKESLLGAAASGMLLCAIVAAAVGAWFVREEYRRDARDFADQAAERIYLARDEQWAAIHVTSQSLQTNGAQRLRYFFQYTSDTLGIVQEIRHADGIARLRFRFPFALEVDARVVAHAQTQRGPAEFYFILLNVNHAWQIDHMWWQFGTDPKAHRQR
jgi:hypothetical protein